jgi:hypothetical protein
MYRRGGYHSPCNDLLAGDPRQTHQIFSSLLLAYLGAAHYKRPRCAFLCRGSNCDSVVCLLQADQTLSPPFLQR